MLFTIIIAVLYLVSAYKVFEKYGEPGWKGLIPFYSNIIEFDKIWNKKMGWIFIALSFVYGIARAIVQSSDDAGLFMSLIVLVAAIAVFVINIKFALKKAAAFGGGTGMKLLLIFIPIIGNLILGFGEAQYQGPQE